MGLASGVVSILSGERRARGPDENDVKQYTCFLSTDYPGVGTWIPYVCHRTCFYEISARLLWYCRTALFEPEAEETGRAKSLLRPARGSSWPLCGSGLSMAHHPCRVSRCIFFWDTPTQGGLFFYPSAGKGLPEYSLCLQKSQRDPRGGCACQRVDVARLECWPTIFTSQHIVRGKKTNNFERKAAWAKVRYRWGHESGTRKLYIIGISSFSVIRTSRQSMSLALILPYPGGLRIKTEPSTLCCHQPGIHSVRLCRC